MILRQPIWADQGQSTLESGTDGQWEGESKEGKAKAFVTVDFLMLRILMSAFAVALSANAQHTWHNLAFGTTETQVQRVLGPELKLGERVADRPQAYTKRLTSPWVMDAKNSKLKFGFQVDLDFSKSSSTLEAVQLKLLIPRELKREDDSLYFAEAAEEVSTSLKNKYGEPTEQKGRPWTVSALIAGAGKEVIGGVSWETQYYEATWRAEGQLIQLRQQMKLVGDEPPDVIDRISYKLLKSDL